MAAASFLIWQVRHYYGLCGATEASVHFGAILEFREAHVASRRWTAKQACNHHVTTM